MSNKKVKEAIFDLNTNEIIKETSENNNNKNEGIDDLADKSTIKPTNTRKNGRKKTDNSTGKNNAQRHKMREASEKEKTTSKRMKMLELLADEQEENLKDVEEYKLEEIKSAVKNKAKTIKSKTQDMSRKSSQISKEMKKKSGEFRSRIGKSLSSASNKAKENMTDINKNIRKTQANGEVKEMLKKNMKIIYIGLAILVIAAAAYFMYYSKMPSLKETHNPDIEGVIASYDGEVHPFEILSSNRERMIAFKGEPDSKGDGKTAETKFVVYKLDWFGKTRESIIAYDKENHFTRIKLNIGNENAADLIDKLTRNFGTPVQDQGSSVKGGYAIWIKDSIQYKLVHHGTYATIEMKLARYDNVNKLKVGKYPIIIHKLSKLDINKDEKQETLVLLGNKTNTLSTNYDKLYLLMWDGKTHLMSMPQDMDGGTYPQVVLKDLDKDGKTEIIIQSDNNEIAKNYNVFKYDGEKLKLTYSGYEEPYKK